MGVSACAVGISLLKGREGDGNMWYMCIPPRKLSGGGKRILEKMCIPM